jgi:hypothetical protein
VTQFIQPLVAGGVVLEAVLVHDQPSTSGSDRETIDSIKTNAPLFFQAVDRAVTQKDLDALINGFIDPVFGSVAIGRATVPRSTSEDAQALTIIQEITNAGAPQDTIDKLTEYWDKVLASDCNANVIVAQILGADVDGRYVPANEGLARSLEVYLDDRAESTAKVQVTDGSINLVSVDTVIEVRPTSDFQGVDQRLLLTNQVRAEVEAVLLGRSYGESLRISDLYTVVDAVEGVDYSHITITGEADALARLNSFGDVVIGDFEVITLGVSPTVTTI